MKAVVTLDFDAGRYKNFSVFKSLDEVVKSPVLPEVVILNSCKEDAVQACQCITELYKRGVSRFYYITETPDTMISLCMTGVRGIRVSDSFYLLDEADLTYLIEDSTDLSIVENNMDVVRDFIDSFSRGDARIQSPVYVEQAKAAIDTLVSEVKLNAEALQTVSTGALQTFEKITWYRNEIANLNDKLTKYLDELDTRKVPNTLESNITKFNQFQFNQHSRIIYIHEWTPVVFLTSFVYIYSRYLKYTRNKTVKLIYLVSKSPTAVVRNQEIDQDAARLTARTANMGSLYGSEVIVTDNPTKDVMFKLLSSDDNYFIVVDRLHDMHQIMNGRFRKLNAIACNSDLSRFKVKPEECIAPAVSCSNPKVFIKLPAFKDLQIDPQAKEHQLTRGYLEYFKQMDKYFDVK